MSTEPAMTVVTAVIKPTMGGKVVRALHDLAEFPGFTLTEVRGQGRGRGAAGAYRATEYDFTYHRHLLLQIVCRSEAAPAVCSAIADAARTGHKGDGVVFSVPALSFLRIRDAGRPIQK
jgi:nitrogen regulatory protein PII